MRRRVGSIVLAGAGLVAGTAGAQAQTAASNNQAYINQVASTASAQVTNQATLIQSGSQNRLGAMNNVVQQSATDGPSNVFTATQDGLANLVGFTPGAASTMVLLQTGAANVATLGQSGSGNVIGGLTQENLLAGGDGNTLVITQTGRRNYVAEVLQRNNGRSANSATIVQTGDDNGHRDGTLLGSGIASINGAVSLMKRSYIGVADAQLQLVFTSNGVSSYYGPGDGAGAAIYQYGGANRADVTTSGLDNNVLVQQNSATTQNGGGNTFAWTASGSSNYAYALQVGTNLASNVVIGNQNAFLVYQAGEAGAGGNGFGNIVTWQQGEKAGDIQNFAEAVQLGSNNSVTGAQLGSLNVFRSYQRGVNNTIAALSVGSNNLIDVVQTGTNNAVNITQGGTLAQASAAPAPRPPRP